MKANIQNLIFSQLEASVFSAKCNHAFLLVGTVPWIFLSTDGTGLFFVKLDFETAVIGGVFFFFFSIES